MRRLAAALTVPILALTVGCAGSTSLRATTTHGSTMSAAASGAGSSTSWPTYHRTAGRSGSTADSIKTPLHHSWSAHLDGAVYGEPLVVHGHVVVATEHDSVYALNRRNGHQVWRRHLGPPQPRSGLPCGNIDPLGITGTPAYDSRTGSLFVVAETTGGHHTLWALNGRTGTRRWHRSLDVVRNRNRSAEQERSALLVTGGRVITAFGGLEGDCDNYVGYVTSVATSGHGHTHHYAVPTSREAGIWSPAGPVRGRNGNVYVAIGNGAETGGRFDKSDSVTELAPTSMKRLGLFAPSTWASDNANDLDLGSSSPVPVNGRIVIAGKRGTVYLLRPKLGGVGRELTTTSGCHAFGGAARVGNVLLMPCRGENAIRALHVGKHSLRWSWSAGGTFGCPIVAGKRVYVPDTNSGSLKVLSLRTGHPVASIAVGSFTHFPSVAVDGNRVFVPTLSGVTAIAGS